MKISPKNHYRAGIGWKGKTLTILFLSFLALFFGSHPEFLFKYWQASGLIGRAGEVFALSMFLLAPLEIFLKRTIFTQTLIERRTMFGVKTAWEYSSVEKLLLDKYALKICFQDGRKVKIASSEGDLERIISIIQERADKSIPIEPAIMF